MIKTEPQKTFVEEQWKQGKYPSYDALVKAGLQLLKEREVPREKELDRIAELLRPAVEYFEQGNPGIEIDFEDIIKRGKQRLAQKMSVNDAENEILSNRTGLE